MNENSKAIREWTIVIAGVVGAIALFVWFSSQSEKNRPGEVYTEQGREHIAVGSAHPAYNSNPPTSGPHYAEEATWGIYQKELPDEQLLHNLEHGGIWISYTGIDQDTQNQLEALAKKDPDKMVVTPRAKDDAKIVVASWTRLLKLDQFNEAEIAAFINANKNKSPEPNAQ